MTEPHEGSAYWWQTKMCNCRKCELASRRRRKTYDIAKSRGASFTLVPAERSRNLYNLLLRRGLSGRQIAAEVGYTPQQLNTLKRNPPGSPKNVRPILYQRLKELEVRTHNPKNRDGALHKSRTDADRSQRAIKGLMLQGYTHVEIGARFDPPMLQQGISRILRDDSTMVAKTTEAVLVKMAQDVGMTPGSSKRVSTIAKNRGYLPLVQWDDLM